MQYREEQISSQFDVSETMGDYRVFGKIAFNVLSDIKGKDYVLDSDFDKFRNWLMGDEDKDYAGFLPEFESKPMAVFLFRQVFKKSLSREYNRSGRKVISYIGCNFFMTLLTRKLGMCIIKICKENLAWRCFYEKGRNLKCKQKRTSQ